MPEVKLPSVKDVFIDRHFEKALSLHSVVESVASRTSLFTGGAKIRPSLKKCKGLT